MMKKYILFVFILLSFLTVYVSRAQAVLCAPGELFNSSTGQACSNSQNNTATNSSTSSVIEITAKTTTEYIDAARPIKEGLRKLGEIGGGTLFFGPGKYIVSETIEVPSNITIQGVGAGEVGPCMIVLGKQGNMNAQGMALFSIKPGAKNVVIRDCELRSMTPGWDVYPRTDVGRIQSEDTTAIRLFGQSGSDINNIQFENLRITNFTHGIYVGSVSGSDAIVKNVSLRSISSYMNYIALRVNTLNATDWSVQNLNIVEMGNQQNGVLLERTGRIGFLQLSCASTLNNANICMDIRERSGPVYIKQAHVEGPRLGFVVGKASSQPVYFDNSAMHGRVEEKNTIYSLGNRYYLDNVNRMVFTGKGASSTLYACGDVYSNFYGTGSPTEAQVDLPFVGLTNQPQGCNFDVTKVNNDFSTRDLQFNLFNWLKTNFSASPNFLNVKTFGAKGDGVTDDTEAFKRALKDVNPAVWSLSTLLVPAGTYKITGTLSLEDGTIIRGEPGSVIEFKATNKPLFQIRALLSNSIYKKAIGINNITIRSGTLNPQTQKTTAIEFSGDRGAAWDMSFNNLDISGFTRALHVRNDSGVFDTQQPLFDSIAVRNLVLKGNYIGIDIRDQNASNWNFENIQILKMKAGQKGVMINGGGNILFRGLRCEGESILTSVLVKDPRADSCVSISRHSGVQIEKMTTKNMKYAFFAEWPIGYTPFPVVLRDSNLSDGVYIGGKINLLSVGNTFATSSSTASKISKQLGSGSIYFNVRGADSSENIYPGDDSNIVSCGDTFVNQAGSANQFVGLKKSAKNCLSSTPTPAKAGVLYIRTITSTIQAGATNILQAMYQPPMPTCAIGLACAQVMPAAYPIKATWTSSNRGVATVAYSSNQPDNLSVVVTGISKGTTNITASYKDSSTSNSSALTASTQITIGPSNSTTTTSKGSVLGAESHKFTLTLKKGSSGNEVSMLQNFLKNAGYDIGSIDGKFGTLTKEAVVKFQLDNELIGDGIVGPMVRAVLNKT